MSNPPSQKIRLTLAQKILFIEEVSVHDNNQRARNVQLFKDIFLGTDEWGKAAILKNEEVLQFRWEYLELGDYRDDQICDDTVHFDLISGRFINPKADSMVSTRVNVGLNVTAKKPLKVSLPELGYSLRYDLVDFIYRYNKVTGLLESRYQGYYFFEPDVIKSRLKNRKVNKNRKLAFYHSSQHLCRALYENNLAKNGYQIFEPRVDSLTQRISLHEFNFDSIAQRVNNQIIILTKKNGVRMVKYYARQNGVPFDISKRKIGFPEKSAMFFPKDTCTIRSNGTIPDYSIIFTTAIGKKRVGAALPFNYQPK